MVKKCVYVNIVFISEYFVVTKKNTSYFKIDTFRDPSPDVWHSWMVFLFCSQSRSTNNNPPKEQSTGTGPTGPELPLSSSASWQLTFKLSLSPVCRRQKISSPSSIGILGSMLNSPIRAFHPWSRAERGSTLSSVVSGIESCVEQLGPSSDGPSSPCWKKNTSLISSCWEYHQLFTSKSITEFLYVAC